MAAENKRLESALAAKESPRIVQLEKEKADQKAAYEAKIAELEVARGDLQKNYSERKVKAKIDRDRRDQEIAAQKKAIEKLADDKAGLEIARAADIAALKKHHDAALKKRDAEIAELKKKDAQRALELDGVKKELGVVRKRINALESQQSKVTDLENDLASKRKEANDAETNLFQAQQDAVNLKTSLETVKGEHAEEIEVRDEHIAQLQAENAALIKCEKDKILEARTAILKDAKAERNRLQRDLTQAQSELDEVRSSRDTFSQAYQKASADMMKLNDAVKEAENDRNFMQSRLTFWTKQTPFGRFLKGEDESLVDNIVRNIVDFKHLGDEISTLREQLRASQQESKMLTAVRLILKAKCLDYENQLGIQNDDPEDSFENFGRFYQDDLNECKEHLGSISKFLQQKLAELGGTEKDLRRHEGEKVSSEVQRKGHALFKLIEQQHQEEIDKEKQKQDAKIKQLEEEITKYVEKLSLIAKTQPNKVAMANLVQEQMEYEETIAEFENGKEKADKEIDVLKMEIASLKAQQQPHSNNPFGFSNTNAQQPPFSFPGQRPQSRFFPTASTTVHPQPTPSFNQFAGSANAFTSSTGTTPPETTSTDESGQHTLGEPFIFGIPNDGHQDLNASNLADVRNEPTSQFESDTENEEDHGEEYEPLEFIPPPQQPQSPPSFRPTNGPLYDESPFFTGAVTAEKLDTEGEEEYEPSEFIPPREQPQPSFGGVNGQTNNNGRAFTFGTTNEVPDTAATAGSTAQGQFQFTESTGAQNPFQFAGASSSNFQAPPRAGSGGMKGGQKRARRDGGFQFNFG